MFPKILVANRGEIAVRIIRACKEMGIQTVAVFSEADRDALHVSLADESYCIGASPVQDSYLNITALLTVAVESGVAAIHPGYGLLSENARFARLCEQCNIAFIGPSPEVIEKMGDKDAARRSMRDAGVPVIEGCDLLADGDMAVSEAERIGCPVLIKARSGGGGRGIRLVEKPQDAKAAYEAAYQEAQAAFGDGECYMEKFLTRTHHVEVQLLCDQFGHAVTLGERECSVQRKNQKLLEESPSPVLSEETREKMLHAARKAAKAVGYQGVGTIEFLYTDDGQFYFMEMNTRLQVEHPVTELVTSVDLVKWQIRVAAGAKLPFNTHHLAHQGHAIECRINAEDPEHDNRPSCGKVTVLHVPGGPGVRFDTALYQDYVIPPFYDSMIGKLIVHAPTREEAIRKMRAALGELVVGGVVHNRELQLEILSNKEFLQGNYHTDLMTHLHK